MTDIVECKISIAMNEDGDWVVVTEHDDLSAIDKLREDIGGTLARVVNFTIKMRPPVAPEIEITIPDSAGEAAVIAVAE